MATPATEATEQQSAQPQIPDEPPVDVVTLLQKKVNAVSLPPTKLKVAAICPIAWGCSLQIIHQSFSIYNFLGALQQLAPPRPFIVDDLLRPNPEHPEWGAIMDTPKVLREQMQNIQSLIDQLPPLQEEVRAQHTLSNCSFCAKRSA